MDELSYNARIGKYAKLLSKNGTSCVELWKSCYTPEEELNVIKHRMSTYTREDWEEMKLESLEIIYDFLQAFRSDLPYDSIEVLKIAERQRLLTDRWFIDNPPERELEVARRVLLVDTASRQLGNSGFYDKFELGLGVYVYNSAIHNAKLKIGQ
jgi:hypothetical protein